jgi:endonuclease/exonuclease/phosphatase (EEP) superfamily protein YafD
MFVAQRAWQVILSASLVPFAGWAAVRLLGVEHGTPSIQLMAFTPYVAAASLVPLAACLLTRRWWHAAVAVCVTVVLLAVVLPRAVPDGTPTAASGHRLRVLSANLLFGMADVAAVAGLARTSRADVLAVQELTPEAAVALDRQGLATLMPYRMVYALPGSGGSGVFSRHPLRGKGLRQMPAGHTQAYATLLAPGARPVVVESAHPCAPSDRRSARHWAHEITLQPAATPEGTPRILIGDFNSTLDHEGLRRLISTGYRDAAEVVGAGLRPTWPFLGNEVMGQRVPPVTIDHVLADRRIGVVSAAVHDIPGSDHRAVSAELVLPPSTTG